MAQREHAFLHAARVAACLAVVTIHVAAPNMLFYNKISAFDWWFGSFLTTAVYWAVPLFTMISGALLLDKEKKESLTVFFKKRITKIGIPMVSWVMLYFIFFHFWQGDSLSPIYVLKRVIFEQGITNLYFLFIICELYLLTPFLRKIIHQLDTSSLWGLTVLFLCIAVFWREQRFVGTMFIPYLGYYLLGYCLTLVSISKKKRTLNTSVFKRKKVYNYWIPMFMGMTKVRAIILLVCLYILFVTVITFLEYLLLSRQMYNWGNDFLFYSHTNPLLICLTVTVFLLIKAWYEPHQPAYPLIKELSKMSLGIYVIHLPVRLILMQFFFGSKNGMIGLPWHTLLVVIVLIFSLSYCITKVITLVPGVRRIV